MKRIESINLDSGATIFKLENRPSWYLELCSRGKRSTKSLKTTVKSKALQISRNEIAKWQDKSWQLPTKAKTLFEEVFEEYREHALFYNAPSTVKLNCSLLKSFYTWLCIQTDSTTPCINHIEPDTIQKFMKYRLQSISIATVNREWRILRLFFNFAVKRHHLTSSPISDVRPLKEDKKLPKTMSTEEIELLLNECLKPIPLIGPSHKGKGNTKERSKTLYNLCVFILNTGARLGEAIHLKREDVDLVLNKIYLRSRPEHRLKDREERQITLNQAAREVTQNQIDNNHNNEWIFTNKNNRVIDKRSIQRSLKLVATKAGISWVNFKTMRKTFATLNATHQPPFVLRYIMGHSSVRTTEKYYIGAMNKHCTPLEVTCKASS